MVINRTSAKFCIFMQLELIDVCASCSGTGLQIPPAAQQALQMSGSLAFGAVAGKRCSPMYFSKIWIILDNFETQC